MPGSPSLVKVGAIAGLTSVMLVLLYGQTRIFYTMSRDGLLPRVMSDHPPALPNPVDQHHHRRGHRLLRRRLPDLDNLADLSNVGSLTAFALVCVTVIYLRFSSPGLKRPFRVPLYPWCRSWAR